MSWFVPICLSGCSSTIHVKPFPPSIVGLGRTTTSMMLGLWVWSCRMGSGGGGGGGGGGRVVDRFVVGLLPLVCCLFWWSLGIMVGVCWSLSGRVLSSFIRGFALIFEGLGGACVGVILVPGMSLNLAYPSFSNSVCFHRACQLCCFISVLCLEIGWLRAQRCYTRGGVSQSFLYLFLSLFVLPGLVFRSSRTITCAGASFPFLLDAGFFLSSFLWFICGMVMLFAGAYHICRVLFLIVLSFYLLSILSFWLFCAHLFRVLPLFSPVYSWPRLACALGAFTGGRSI